MNVLLVTYSFPPAAGVGVLRALSLTKYFPENGLRVDVLTARNAAAVGHDPKLLDQLPPGVTVHRTWTLDLPFGVRKAIKKLVAGKENPARPKSGAAAAHGSAPAARLKRLIGNLLLPDPQVGWLPFASRAAARIVRERQIDVVLVTVPPFSSVRLISRLRRLFPALPLVLDFRDEWLTTTINLVSFNNNERARAVAQKAESEAVRDATITVCVTEAAVRELRKRYPELPPARFACVPNGFDRPAPTRIELGAGRMQDAVLLTYIGTVYGSTDPAPVVRAILSLPEEIRARLRLRFIGHIETPALRESLLRLTAGGVGLELIGFLPQAEALRYVDQTDYLLLITHDPINVAAKLYDYLSSGRPIVAAVHPTGDVHRILEQTRAGWSASIDNVDEIARLIADAVERGPELEREFRPNTEAIARYHRRPLAAQYAELLRRVAARERRGGAAATAGERSA